MARLGHSREFDDRIEVWLAGQGPDLDLSYGGFAQLPDWIDELCASGGKISSDLVLDLTRNFGHLSVFGDVGHRHALLWDMSEKLENVLGNSIVFFNELDYLDPDQISPIDSDAASTLSEALGEFYLAVEIAQEADVHWTAGQLDIFRRCQDEFGYPRLRTLVRISKVIASASEPLRKQISSKMYARVTATRKLNLQGNHFSHIPSFVQHLPHLEILILEGNPLLRIAPEDLQVLPASLKTLEIGGCDLRDVGQISGGTLAGVELLSLSGAIGPISLSVTLPKLRTLVANDVRNLAELTVHAPELDEIDLSSTYIVDYGGVLDQAVELRIVRLAKCALTSLPRFVSTKVAALDASANDLSSLDIGPLISIFDSLSVLDLSSNSLTQLPDKLSALRALSSLDLSANELTTLPVSISEMTNLREIDLSGNPLPDTVLKAASGGAEDLRQFIRALGVNPAISNQAKALVIGEGAVGKTSLISAICGREFVANRPTTHGIELSSVSLDERTDNLLLNDRLVFWDFGGQEVYRVTHPFFFSRDAIYLVTWRPREGMEQAGLEFWMEAIRHRIGVQHCSVLLVSTHSEEGRTSRIDEEAIENEYYPAVKGFFSVDSETGVGVSAIRERCHALLRQLPHYGSPIPTAWVALRRSLPEIPDGFLMLGQYERMAAVHGLDASAARSCARLLHTLGDLLYFDESDGLAPVIVTDPEILTRAVSYLMEDVNTQAQGGVVDLRRVRDLWESQMVEVRSNPDIVGVLVNLIRRFDVGLEVRTGGGLDALLLPDMVPFARPLDLPWEPRDAPRSGEEELRLDIRCSSTPTGLLPWMIVRNFQMLRRWVWRTGAYFERERHGASALIEWNPDRRVLSLTVRGAYPLDTFQGLKNDVESLMATRWPYLPLSYFVPCPHRFELRCDGEFELDYIERKIRANDREGECRKCLRKVDLMRVITGLGPSHDRLGVIEERLNEVGRSADDIRRIVGEMSLSLRHLRESIVRGLDDTPLVFTISPSGWTGASRVTPRRLWARPFDVQLWCEYWDAPHPHGECYGIRVEKAWFGKCYPYLKHVAAILKLSPVIRSAGELLGDDASVKRASDALGFIDACADLSLSIGAMGIIESGGSDSGGMTGGPMGIEARFIQSLILDLELEPRSFRGLHPLVMPGRAVAWLCPKHFGSAQERPVLHAPMAAATVVEPIA